MATKTDGLGGGAARSDVGDGAVIIRYKFQ